MKVLGMIFILMGSLFTYGQESELLDTIQPIYFQNSDSIDYVEFPDKEAEFPGGYLAMSSFILENMNYPTESIEMAEQGKVRIQFFVCEDGRIENVRMIRSVSEKVDQLFIGLIESMPNWIPAELDGRKVKTLASLPIYICF